MRVVYHPQKIGLQAMNDVLLALRERMTMQTLRRDVTFSRHRAMIRRDVIERSLIHMTEE